MITQCVINGGCLGRWLGRGREGDYTMCNVDYTMCNQHWDGDRDGDGDVDVDYTTCNQHWDGDGNGDGNGDGVR